MSTFNVDNVFIGGLYLISRINVSVGSLDSEGVLEIELENGISGSDLFLDNGVTLKGVRLLSNGERLVLDDEIQPVITVSSAGLATLVHNSGDVSNTTDRFSTTSGLNVFVTKRRIQLLWSKRSGSWIWEVPDLTPTAPITTYTPSTSSDWIDPDPTTVQQALDRLAAMLSPVS